MGPDYNDIGEYFLKNFKDLYKSDSLTFPKDLEGLFEKVIDEEENARLIETPTNEEIFSILKIMPSLKSLGPDGFLVIFYKHYWGSINHDVISAVKRFFQNGFLLKEWKNTFIILIPKCKGANTFKDFRPISLSNVCYKLISKIISNRLKPFLDRIISPHQTAFIQGRWINENSLVVQEILHFMNKSRSKKGFVGLKIGMAKVFDKVEWPFLLNILR